MFFLHEHSVSKSYRGSGARSSGFLQLKNSKTILILILSSIIFCMLSWFLYHHVSPVQPHCDIDSKAYLERGLLFYKTNRFVTPQNPEQPYYALGYAGIIGTLYTLYGQSTAIIIFFQILLSLLSCLLMMHIAHRLFSDRAARFAALFFVLSVGYATFVQFVLTEITLSFFLLLFFERMTAWLCINNTHKTPLIFAALALGTSIVIKPAALYFVFPVCLLLLCSPGSWQKRIVSCLLFAAFFYLPVVGYMTYNKYAFDRFGLGALDRVNMYYWFFPNVLAHKHQTTSDNERSNLLALSDGAHNFAAVESLFWQELKADPLSFGRVWVINVFKTWAGLYTTNLKVLIEPQVYGGSISYFKMSGNYCVKAWNYIVAGATQWWVCVVGLFEALWSFVRYIFVFWGLWFLFKRRQYAVLMLSVLFLAYFSFITGHDGCARFRMMYEFLLIILAAGGIFPVLKDQ
jgi:4-amino-4-deoxy-L-arabinose transferase-like glycosyltransferase